jgi:hypothetical protein
VIREDHKRRADIVAAGQIKLPELLKHKGARKGFLRLFAEPSLACGQAAEGRQVAA